MRSTLPAYVLPSPMPCAMVPSRLHGTGEEIGQQPCRPLPVLSVPPCSGFPQRPQPSTVQTLVSSGKQAINKMDVQIITFVKSTENSPSECKTKAPLSYNQLNCRAFAFLYWNFGYIAENQSSPSVQDTV